MAGWVGRLVEVDYAIADIRLEVTLQWLSARWDRCIMRRTDIHYMLQISDAHSSMAMVEEE